MATDRPPRPGARPRLAARAPQQAVARPLAAALALPPTHLAQIEESHERCAALGLSRIERPDFTPLGRADLALARERNLRLHAHAAPVMEMLHEQIVDTDSMVVLCDATGTVIHSIGDDDFLDRASKVALAPGANWSEPAKGTNGIGTALIAEAPTLVHADEHYLHANHFLTCSATPILDPRGNILGVLDVSGDHRSYHPHTMALVTMSARMIENHWLSDDYRDALRLHFHARPGHIGTLMEGILAVAPDGRIVGANRSALEQLGLSSVALRQRSLMALFGSTVGALVDRFRSPLARPLQAYSEDGRSFHLVARFDWPVAGGAASAGAGWHPVRFDTPQRALPRADVPAPAPASLAWRWADLQTDDTRVAALIDRLHRVRDSGLALLIQGETGTGKEVLARAVHAESLRAAGPFVAVACAQLAEAALESALFGRPGAVSQSRGGTLFLDEVGALPAPLQARLLQALESQRDGPDAGLHLVCSNRGALRGQVERGDFRDDLYYQLDGLAVTLPSLRERSDQALLARRILESEAPGAGMLLDDEALRLIEAHPWPGNLRQLRQVLRAAVALAQPATTITPAHLPEGFAEEARKPEPPDAPAPASLGALEREAIRHALAQAGGNLSLAARQLGIGRNTLYRKLRREPGGGG